MNDIILKKLRSILDEILIPKKITLFVVIKRDDSDLWDLVIGGEQLDNQVNLSELAELINKRLDRNEIILFSRLVLLNSTDLFVKNFNQVFSMETSGSMEIQNSQINNVFIKQAYLLYSKL
ncbi:MAG TPA: hypothetical protein VLK22_02580 [Candidatus Udaeobacter sp.]|nr:hypothetical protein [Candidatus Udaeobacter sp.]